MKRDMALTCLRVAGAENDTAAFLRLYIENRVSYKEAMKAFKEGAAMAKAGIPARAK